MNLDVKTIMPKLIVVLRFLQKNIKLIVVVVVVMIYAFLVYRVNSLSLAVPDEDTLNEKLAEVRVPKIDQTAVDAIDQLESRSIEVKALFEQARSNPFQD